MPNAKNWLDEIIPFPRVEYAKQTESLLTDLIWRSPGSNVSGIAGDGLISQLSNLRAAPGFTDNIDPDRLVPERLHGGSQRLCETFPIAKGVDLSSIVAQASGATSLVDALLRSILAPRSRGDKSAACVPLHPAVIALQTLHGLVNKPGPSNLAGAIETMGWLGGASSYGSTAIGYLKLFSGLQTQPQHGLTGLVDALLPLIGKHTWENLPARLQVNAPNWPTWPTVGPAGEVTSQSLLASYRNTPFHWFWRKWETLCKKENGWFDALPSRRFTDWALSLLRTGLAFSYLWEAEFFCRIYEGLLQRKGGASPTEALSRLKSLLEEGLTIASIDPLDIPPIEKNLWPALADLIGRGYEAREAVYDLDCFEQMPLRPEGATFLQVAENWIAQLTPAALAELPPRIEPKTRTANNQKEFVRYLMLPRSSDDDSVDQADFYYLMRSNSRYLWFQPGPEWLVVEASLLCGAAGRFCTLGQLLGDMAALGVRVERSVLVTLLEEAGLSTDSPDADNAIVVRSGF